MTIKIDYKKETSLKKFKPSHELFKICIKRK